MTTVTSSERDPGPAQPDDEPDDDVDRRADDDLGHVEHDPPNPADGEPDRAAGRGREPLP